MNVFLFVLLILGFFGTIMGDAEHLLEKYGDKNVVKRI